MQDNTELKSSKLVAGVNVSMVADAVQNAMRHPPLEINRNIILDGNAAARYFFVETMLMESLGLTRDEASAYIFCAGAEREIERFSAYISQLHAQSRDNNLGSVTNQGGQS